MKNVIIKLNDVVCYIIIVVFTLVGFFSPSALLVAGGMPTSVSLVSSIIGAVIGFLTSALFAGFWFVLSGMYQELRRMNGSRGL